MIRSLLSILLYFSSFPALAMYGQVTSSSIPESACRLTATTILGDIIRVCSGTLISSNEVATAAHCVEDAGRWAKFQMRVDCGFQGTDPDRLRTELNIQFVPVWNEGLIFKETHMASKYFINSGRSVTDGKSSADTALIVLDTPSEIDSIPIANTREPKNCKVTGFGKGPVDRIAGLPFQGSFTGINYVAKMFEKSTRVKSVPHKDHLFVLSLPTSSDPLMDLMEYLVDNKHLELSTNGGDSGGGLICEVGGVDHLVAVVQGGVPEVDVIKFSLSYTQHWVPYDLSVITKEIFPKE